MIPTKQTPLLWSVDECAERLNLNRSAIYRAIGSGDLRSCKYGKLRRVSEQAIQEFIAKLEGRQGGDPSAA